MCFAAFPLCSVILLLFSRSGLIVMSSQCKRRTAAYSQITHEPHVSERVHQSRAGDPPHTLAAQINKGSGVCFFFVPESALLPVFCVLCSARRTLKY